MTQESKQQINFKKQKIFHIRHYDYLTQTIKDERYTLKEAIIAYQNLKRYGMEVDLYMNINGIEYCLL